MDQNTAKRLAAEAALKYLPDAGVVGLGSGSTARLFIDGVGQLVKAGRALRGVPTSNESREQAESLGIETLPDDGPWDIDVCVDGADEVSASLDLIKGGGGCHTREKIVNQASRTNIIIVDESKLSQRLAERYRRVPVEVLAFAHEATRRCLSELGEPGLRSKDGQAFRTDSGNYIYDLVVAPIDDPAALDARLLALPGVVETGLFVGRADRVIVAGGDGIRELVRPA